ncbi:hypothetical protein [Hymenobacter saemangeumensis]|uniref:hypothetical protein n=1 Tax=Hymenobacter saemangeumensis TaxID=1084522 RepID=UPI0031F157BF
MEESVRFVRLYQEHSASDCNYTLYVFKPSQSPYFHVKKFAVSWKDTFYLESPPVPLSPQRSAALDRLFRQASRIVVQPYSVHFTPSARAAPKEREKKKRDDFRVAFAQRAPYRFAGSRWSMPNPYVQDPVNKSLVMAWRKKRALHRLRRILRDFTSCP